jgi:ABC-type sugar transport system substrate-binding protein
VSTPTFVRIMAAVAMALALFASGQPLLAQPMPGLKRIGVALSGYGPESRPVQAFRRGLEEAGYAEGRDLVLDIRSVKGDPDLADAVVTGLLANKVDVLVVESTAIALAAKRANDGLPSYWHSSPTPWRRAS